MAKLACAPCGAALFLMLACTHWGAARAAQSPPPPGFDFGQAGSPVDLALNAIDKGTSPTPSFCASKAALWKSDTPAACRTQLRDTCKSGGGTVCYVPKSICDIAAGAAIALDWSATTASMISRMCKTGNQYEFCLTACLPGPEQIRKGTADFLNKSGVDNDCKGNSPTDKVCQALGGADKVNKLFEGLLDDPVKTVTGAVGGAVKDAGKAISNVFG